jgi:hypothetical protein
MPFVHVYLSSRPVQRRSALARIQGRFDDDPESVKALPELSVADVFITDELDRRAPKKTDYLREKLALQDLAMRMADQPEEVLPRFVDLALEMTGGVSAGLSLYEEDPAPGVFRWQHLRGALASFNGATTPRNFSPCGITLDRNAPVLSAHPERVMAGSLTPTSSYPRFCSYPFL